MGEYRIYSTDDVRTVITDSPFVTVRVERDGMLFCVGTGKSPEEIAKHTYKGRLGSLKTDSEGRGYRVLYYGD